MKLSDAIRLGSMLGPQAYGQLHRTRRKYWLFGPLVNEYCAMGAAYTAIGGGSHEEVATTAHVTFRGPGVKAGDIVDVLHHDQEWMDVFYGVFVCPQCLAERPLSELIPHLNDRHRWNRQQIANFVETLEQQVDRELMADVQDEVELGVE